MDRVSRRFHSPNTRISPCEISRYGRDVHRGSLSLRDDPLGGFRGHKGLTGTTLIGAEIGYDGIAVSFVWPVVLPWNTPEAPPLSNTDSSLLMPVLIPARLSDPHPFQDSDSQAECFL